MVRPKMEYAATVWDPYYQSDIQHLEKVQCRAARWVYNDFSTYSSVTDMLQQLSWPTLQVCRKICRLLTLNNESPLTIPSYYLQMERATIPNATPSPLHLLIYYPCFYYRTIHDWNALPPYLILIILTNSLMNPTNL